MTLKEWSKKWPYRINYDLIVWTCDTVHDARVEAWQLEDYIVVSVSCGAIFFEPRFPSEKKA